MTGRDEYRLIATNKKAYHDYFIEETFEVGLVLQGTEVKSIRDARVNLKESYAFVKDSEVYIENMHISPYSHGNITNHDPLRRRKLLMHKLEIKRLIGKVKEKGYTLKPLKMYIKNGRVKMELGLAKGKLLHDKRQTIATKDAKRDMERAFRERQKS